MRTHFLFLLLLSTQGQSEHWFLYSKPTPRKVSLALVSHTVPKEILHHHTTVQSKALSLPVHASSFPQHPETQNRKKPNMLHEAQRMSFKLRKAKYQRIFPGCQETIDVTADLCLPLVSLSIFTTAHSHYILESFYQFVEAVAKVFEISHRFFNYFFRPRKHLPKGEYFLTLERYHLGQILPLLKSKFSNYQTSST